MKKIVLIISILLLITGCSNNESKNKSSISNQKNETNNTKVKVEINFADAISYTPVKLEDDSEHPNFDYDYDLVEDNEIERVPINLNSECAVFPMTYIYYYDDDGEENTEKVCSYEYEYDKGIKSVLNQMSHIGEARFCYVDAKKASHSDIDFISKYNICIKDYVKKQNEGLEPYDINYDTFEGVSLDINLSTPAAYFLYKNVDEKNEREFLEKMINYFFKSSSKYNKYDYEKYIVTVYPVHINDIFAYYAIKYDRIVLNLEYAKNKKIDENKILEVYEKQKKEQAEIISKESSPFKINKLGLVIAKMDYHFDENMNEKPSTAGSKIGDNYITIYFDNIINMNRLYNSVLNCFTKEGYTYGKDDISYLNYTNDFVNKEATVDYYEIIKENYDDIVNEKYDRLENLIKKKY